VPEYFDTTVAAGSTDYYVVSAVNRLERAQIRRSQGGALSIDAGVVATVPRFLAALCAG